MANKPNDSLLIAELSKLPPRRRDLVKQAYYRTIEGLQQLQRELEFADMDTGGKAGPLLDLHFVTLNVMEQAEKLGGLGRNL